MPRHSIALTGVLLALVGCQSAPERVVVPEVVRVVVTEYIEVPPRLTAPCITPELPDRLVGSVVETSNARKICEDQLNEQLREIRELPLPTPDLTDSPDRGTIKP